MAEKVLTISVAAYNVADYLKQTLESCLALSYKDFEVLIVNDGSSDTTAQIAADYEKHYPDIFKLVSKENGGYGSTVNTALEVAQGKYFKLLDGDDWFDTDGLESLLSVLRDNDVDLVLTPYVRQEEGVGTKIVDQAEGIEERIWDFDECPIPWRISMHSMAYRTALVRESGLRLEEHCVYTDTDYITEPLHRVHTVYVSHTPVYQYRIGREGQSMERAGRIRHRGEMESLIYRMLKRWPSLENTNTTAERVCRAWLIDDIVGHLQLLYSMDASDQIKDEILRFTEYVRTAAPALYRDTLKHSQWAFLFDKGGARGYKAVSAAYHAFLAVKDALKR
ncbi:MAG: glycosyltransferase family 2 protein [Actinomycetaceae bacterium]|nr:glycosyltransferase family 2 protein [Actinomycetaceae bacterium]